MTNNKAVLAWVDEMVALTKPDRVVWIDGSEEQLNALRAEACKTGEMELFKPGPASGLLLSPHRGQRRCACRGPYVHLHPDQEEAGPTNNWMAPDEMYKLLWGLLRRRHAWPHLLCAPPIPCAPSGPRLPNTALRSLTPSTLS